jgi:predicted phosphodiesterase/transposase-like protein
MTVDEKQRVRELYLGGKTSREIAQEIGVPRMSVTNYLTRAGVRKTRPKPPPEPPPEIPEKPETALTERIITVLRRSQGRAAISTLADSLDVSPKRIREAMESLRDSHYMASFDDDTAELLDRPAVAPFTRVDPSVFGDGEWIRFGAVSDTHLCSNYERLDALNALYDLYEREGITTVYHAGNWIDGEAGFNKQDIHVHGSGRQCRYFVENYPQRTGIKTYYISGDDHEGWYMQREGIDVGDYAQSLARKAGREDLVYLGYMEHDLAIGEEGSETILRVLHPGGGSAYAISYTTQKLVESLSGGEKPAIMLAGHYHKAELLYYRNVHIIQTGCVCDQTPFMRKKRLAAHVGGWLVEAHRAPDGSINRLRAEWIPFFDREYTEKAWSYKGID